MTQPPTAPYSPGPHQQQFTAPPPGYQPGPGFAAPAAPSYGPPQAQPGFDGRPPRERGNTADGQV